LSVLHLAQVNVARPLEPLTSPLLAEFVAALAPVNALADAAPGFVWRLQTEDGDATAIRLPEDEGLIVNMSVWESLDALRDFVYGGSHVGIMRRRREWFARMGRASTACWWVPAGTVPTVAEAGRRLALLRALGPSPDAFTLARWYPPEGGDVEGVDPRATCGVS
jgi:hypothetical protein